MKLRKIITLSASALILANIGAFTQSSHKANASQPSSSERISGIINNHYIYGYIGKWNRSNTAIKGKKRILLPSLLRHKGTHVEAVKGQYIGGGSKIMKGYDEVYITPIQWDKIGNNQKKSNYYNYLSQIWINPKDVSITKRARRYHHAKRYALSRRARNARAIINRNNKMIKRLQSQNHKERMILRSYK